MTYGVVNLGTRAAKHQGSNWGMRMTDGCSLELCSGVTTIGAGGAAAPGPTATRGPKSS